MRPLLVCLPDLDKPYLTQQRKLTVHPLLPAPNMLQVTKSVSKETNMGKKNLQYKIRWKSTEMP